jgi:pimeloyl-ACP methyl ester carboxylesterase
MQEHTFTHEGHTLHYVTAGSPENPPILMVHGYTSSHHVWRTTIPVLEKSLYCVAIDLLGHGDSPVDPNGDHSIEAQGRRVLALADHLGFDRFSLIGHSMGGQTVLCIASMLAPERVDKLVDVDGVAAGKLTPFVERTVALPVMLFHRTPVGPLMEVFQRVMAPRYRWAAHIQFTSWFYDFNCVAFDWWRIDRQLANRPGIRHAWYRSMNAMKALNLTDHLPQIKAPTLVIFGAQDNVVPVSDGHLADERIPNSQLVLIENCGHFPMYEKQAEYCEAVRAFLTD